MFVLRFSTLLCPLASSFSSLLGYSIIFGLFHGSLSTVVNVLVLTSVHEGQRALALGFWLFCMSIMIALNHDRPLQVGKQIPCHCSRDDYIKVRTGPGKPGKSRNCIFTFETTGPGKSWKSAQLKRN